MAAKGPERQHYVPRFLLDNFCSDDGYFWVADKNTGAVWNTKPGSSFVVKHLYTKSAKGADSRGRGPKSLEYENSISQLESSVAPVITKIITRMREETHFALSDAECDIAKRFLMAMARRTPEAQLRMMLDPSFEPACFEVAQELAHKHGCRPPAEQSLMRDHRVRAPTARGRAKSGCTFRGWR